MSDHSQHRVYDRDCDICMAQEAAANAWESNKILEKRNALLEAVAEAARDVRSWPRNPVSDKLRAAVEALDAPPATERGEKGEG